MAESKSHVPAYDELVPKKEAASAASAASNKAALCKICKKTIHAKDGNKLLFEKIKRKKKKRPSSTTRLRRRAATDANSGGKLLIWLHTCYF